MKSESKVITDEQIRLLILKTLAKINSSHCSIQTSIDASLEFDQVVELGPKCFRVLAETIECVHKNEYKVTKPKGQVKLSPERAWTVFVSLINSIRIKYKLTNHFPNQKYPGLETYILYCQKNAI